MTLRLRTPFLARARQDRDLTITLGATAASVMFGFLASVMTNRILGPTGRGQLTSAQLISTVAALGWLGLPLAVPYFVARQPDDAKEYFFASLVIAMLGSVPFVVTLWALLRWLLPDRPPIAYAAARVQLLSLPLLLVLSLASATLRGLKKTLAWNVLRAAPWLISLLAVLAVGVTEANAFRVSVVTVVLAAVFSALTLEYIRRRLTDRPLRSSLRHSRALVAFALPGALQSVPQLLNYRVDQILVAKFHGDAVTGLYATAAGWSGLSSLLVASYANLVVPAIASATADEIDAVRRSLVRRGVVISTALSLGLAGITPIVFTAIYGRSFQRAVGPAVALSLAACMLGVGYVYSELARGMGRPKDSLYAETAGVSATLLLLFVALPRYPLYGGVIASIGGYSATLAVLLALSHRHRRRPA